MTAVEIRALAGQAEYEACAALQRETWGERFTDVVPPSILQVSQRIGGVAAGAFEEERLVGFVFGMTGTRAGRIVHWSDMLAVRPEARGRGLARALKEYQRARAREAGAVAMYWTFDPLVARNANFNFNALRVVADEYVVNMYGVTGSALHGGLETDRLIVRWPIDDAGASGGPSVGADGRDQMTVEVPADFEELLQSRPDVARRLRHESRAAFARALSSGFAISGFHLDGASGKAWYVLRAAAR